jgi:hypothetical protein
MSIDIEINSSCEVEKKFCIDCNSHFLKIRPLIKTAVITKHFIRDVKNESEAVAIAKSILDCSHIDFTELHKFEESINRISVFRAKKDGSHIVYCAQKESIIFLRSIRNFEEYEKFINNPKAIKKMVESLDSKADKSYNVI